MKIGAEPFEEMCAHARRGYPFEVCGVLLGLGAAVDAIVPVDNRELAHPRVRYEIAPRDLLRVQRLARNDGREIVGYYHSHPDHPARPSETDRLLAAEGLSDGVFHVVVGVDRGQQVHATAWVFREGTLAFEPVALEVAASVRVKGEER